VSKKGDARIARTVQQKLKNQEKSARLVERIKDELPKQRTVRQGADPGSIYNMLMTWTIEKADREDFWSWGSREWGADAWTHIIAPKLAQFERMLWREIEAATTDTGRRMHHSMPIELVCSECQTRLIELEKLDDDIYRFRLGNNRRLWGFRIVSEFEILWYDPLHQVYPLDTD
jgi:hypothetical protein